MALLAAHGKLCRRDADPERRNELRYHGISISVHCRRTGAIAGSRCTNQPLYSGNHGRYNSVISATSQAATYSRGAVARPALQRAPGNAIALEGPSTITGAGRASELHWRARDCPARLAGPVSHWRPPRCILSPNHSTYQLRDLYDTAADIDAGVGQQFNDWRCRLTMLAVPRSVYRHRHRIYLGACAIGAHCGNAALWALFSVLIGGPHQRRACWTQTDRQIAS